MYGPGKPILLFDGECNLCNSTVKFIIRRDKKKVFLFAPLQSVSGQEALRNFSPDIQQNKGSVLLFYKDHVYSRSGAALLTLKLLGFPWALLYAFVIIPPFLRNAVYDLVARNRTRWFGKSNECMIPDESVKDRFL